jgi:hypothetical protein
MGEALLYGAPGTIRTCDRLIRSQVLYPAELRALKRGARIGVSAGNFKHNAPYCRFPRRGSNIGIRF